MILQMGNADPRHKDRKQGLSRNRIARPVYNWKITSSLYTTHSQSAGGNHRSVIIGARQPITARFLIKHGQQQFKPTALEASTTISTQNSWKLKSAKSLNPQEKHTVKISPKASNTSSFPLPIQR
ncbi:transcription regulator [Dorcoceras hygrometricum]|uniref:Transcription regulator n=1 Tax=Dorcoceras hygrometricum TaxID=472368 RepID=A0A2Z7D672_9LAMI|nr:transcription regulator [Dorcoceras hygrometricum]